MRIEFYEQTRPDQKVAVSEIRVGAAFKDRVGQKFYLLVEQFHPEGGQNRILGVRV